MGLIVKAVKGVSAVDGLLTLGSAISAAVDCFFFAIARSSKTIRLGLVDVSVIGDVIDSLDADFRYASVSMGSDPDGSYSYVIRELLRA